MATIVWAVCIPAATAQTADELVDQHIKALGGTKALKAVKSIHFKGKLDLGGMMGDMTGTVETIVMPGKKVYSAMDTDMFTQKSGYNGTEAWSEDMMQGLRKLEGAEADNLKGQLYLPHPLAKSIYVSGEGSTGTLEKVEDETLDGAEHHVIKSTGGGSPDTTFYLDKKTHLLTRAVLQQSDPQMGEVTIVITYSDYKELEGVQVPYGEEMNIADGMITIKSTYDEVTVNGKIDQGIFDMPETGTP